MNPLMTLVVGWTLVGAFVFTVLITCLSLVGWIRLADPRQQRKLFQVLIVEVVLGIGSSVAGAAQFNPRPVGERLRAEGGNDAIRGALDELLTADAAGPRVTRETAEKLVDRIDTTRSPREAPLKADLHARIRQLPSGTISPEAAGELKKTLSLPRTTTLRLRDPNR